MALGPQSGPASVLLATQRPEMLRWQEAALPRPPGHRGPPDLQVS